MFVIKGTLTPNIINNDCLEKKPELAIVAFSMYIIPIKSKT